MVKEVAEQTFGEETQNGTVLVDFWAPWCGPCRMVAPVLDELQQEMGDKVKVIKVNVDENPNVAQSHGVSGIPTMVLYKNGEVVDRLVGAGSIQTYRDLLNRHN